MSACVRACVCEPSVKRIQRPRQNKSRARRRADRMHHARNDPTANDHVSSILFVNSHRAACSALGNAPCDQLRRQIERRRRAAFPPRVVLLDVPRVFFHISVSYTIKGRARVGRTNGRRLESRRRTHAFSVTTRVCPPAVEETHIAPSTRLT